MTDDDRKMTDDERKKRTIDSHLLGFALDRLDLGFQRVELLLKISNLLAVIILAHELAALRALEPEICRLLKIKADTALRTDEEVRAALAIQALLEHIQPAKLQVYKQILDPARVEGPVIDIPPLLLILLAREGDQIGIIEPIEHVTGGIDLHVDLISEHELRDILLVLKSAD